MGWKFGFWSRFEPKDWNKHNGSKQRKTCVPTKCRIQPRKIRISLAEYVDIGLTHCWMFSGCRLVFILLFWSRNLNQIVEIKLVSTWPSLSFYVRFYILLSCMEDGRSPHKPTTRRDSWMWKLMQLRCLVIDPVKVTLWTFRSRLGRPVWSPPECA